VSGEGSIIRDLLWNIRDAYRFMNRTFTKSPINSSRGGSSMMGIPDNKGKKQNENLKVFMPQEKYVLNTEERQKILVHAKYAQN